MAKTEGDRLRAEFKRRMWPYLRTHGFSAFSSVRAWRYGARWVDVIEFSPRSGGGEPGGTGASPHTVVEAPWSTFGLEVGIYYTDRRLLPWTEKTLEKPWAIHADRLVTLHRPRDEAAVSSCTFWGGVDHSLDQAIATLEARGFGYLERYHDIPTWLVEPEDRSQPIDLDYFLDDAGRAELARFKARYPGEMSRYFLASSHYQPFAAAVLRLHRAGVLTDAPDASMAMFNARISTADPHYKDKTLVAETCAHEELSWRTLASVPKAFPNLAAAMDRYYKAPPFSDHLYATAAEPDDDLRTALLLGEGRIEEALAFFRSRNEESVLQGWLDDYIQEHSHLLRKEDSRSLIQREFRWRTKNTHLRIAEGKERIALLEAAHLLQ